MENKLPYYMAYPMPLVYDDERRERMDFEYMKSMYPDAAKKEFEGSMIYDEYPDRLQLRLIGSRLLDKAKKDHAFAGLDQGSAEKKDRDGNWLWDLIQVMLYQEVYKRRCDYRKCRRKYYPGIEPR